MIQCKDILLLPTMAKAKLIAGKSGLNRQVRWSYKAESMNFAQWVHGQELLIVSTAIIRSTDFHIETIVKEAVRLKLSGVLLLTGEEFISEIPANVCSLADRFHLPLILLPGSVPLIDVFEELGHAIAYQDHEKYRTGDLLSGIVFATSINREMLAYQAKLIGYSIDKPQRIFMVHLTFNNPVSAADRMPEFQELAEELFRQKNCPVLISSFNCNLIGMTGAAQELIEDIFTCFLSSHLLKDEDSCQIGVGDICQNAKRLKESFREASRCIALTDHCNSKTKVLWFEKLGFIRVLLSMENRNIPLQYMNQTLGPILAHDEACSGHLLETLQAWFDCDENMKSTAGLLFTHPNTIKYRLQKIEELTGMTLSKSRDKAELQNALLIRTYLSDAPEE